MKAWDQFLKHVMPKVPGCPEPRAEDAIKIAAQRFFSGARVWKSWLAAITTTADTQTYSIPLDTNTELVMLEAATLDGRPIEVRTEEMLPRDWKTYPNSLGTGVHTEDGKTIYLLPVQAAGMSLLLQASMRPGDAAEGISDDFFSQYALSISYGAIALLKEDTKTPYSDPDGARGWHDKFNGEMVTENFRRFRGRSTAMPRRQIKTF